MLSLCKTANVTPQGGLKAKLAVSIPNTNTSTSSHTLMCASQLIKLKAIAA